MQIRRSKEPGFREATGTLVHGGLMQVQSKPGQPVAAPAMPIPPAAILAQGLGSEVDRPPSPDFHARRAFPRAGSSAGAAPKKSLALRDRVSLSGYLDQDLKAECLERLERVAASQAPLLRPSSWTEDWANAATSSSFRPGTGKRREKSPDAEYPESEGSRHAEPGHRRVSIQDSGEPLPTGASEGQQTLKVPGAASPVATCKSARVAASEVHYSLREEKACTKLPGYEKGRVGLEALSLGKGGRRSDPPYRDFWVVTYEKGTDPADRPKPMRLKGKEPLSQEPSLMGRSQSVPLLAPPAPAAAVAEARRAVAAAKTALAAKFSEPTLGLQSEEGSRCGSPLAMSPHSRQVAAAAAAAAASSGPLRGHGSLLRTSLKYALQA